MSRRPSLRSENRSSTWRPALRGREETEMCYAGVTGGGDGYSMAFVMKSQIIFIANMQFA